MPHRPTLYLWLGGISLVALGLNYAYPWSMMALTGFTLAYLSKGIRRSLKAGGEKNQKN